MTDQQMGATCVAIGLFFIFGGIRLIRRKDKIYKKAFQRRAVTDGWFAILFGCCIASLGISMVKNQ